MTKPSDPVQPPVDPDRPLPGPPDPWQSAEQPADRSGPPWFMTEMIAAEPALGERLLARLADDPAVRDLAAEIRAAAAAGLPVVLVGCGTSEHAAQGSVEILREAWRRAGLPGAGPVAEQAFEAALEPSPGGLWIAITHDGGTPATNRAVAAAGAAGARTAMITVSRRASGAAGIDLVIETVERDQSYCHTIGYVSPLLAATALGATLTGDPVDRRAVRALLAAGLGAAPMAAAEAIAGRLAGARPILAIASGADRPAARELVMKLEEGTWIPAAMRDLETYLHGHLPSTDGDTGLVLIMAERLSRDDRVARARDALEASAEIGLRAAAIISEGVAAELDPGLTPAGRIVVPEAPDLPAPVAALLGTVTPLQLIVERIARRRGTNPDPIRRDDRRYAAAAARAEG